MKRTIILLFFITAAGSVLANPPDTAKHPMPLKISLLNESISFPNFAFTRYRFNPTVMVGTERILKVKRNHDWHLTGNVGFYHHKRWQNAAFISSEIGYRLYFGRVAATARFGLGYAHTFSASKVYKQEGGEWKEAKDWGNPTLTTSLALGAEYNFNDQPNSPAVFLTYMSSMETPFTIYTGLHHFVGVGYKFYPFKRN